MKRIFTIVILITALATLCALPVFAITEAEIEAQVALQGKEKVTGNIFIWFLCAIAFLKVSQKIDTFMSSLGINVGHTGGSMLGELMIAFKGIKAASGGAFGNSSGSHSTTNNETFLAGGLAGAVGRTAERNAASSVTNQSSRTLSQKLYNSSVQKGGDFANTVIGAVAKGNISEHGTITGDRAAEAMTSYFGHVGKADAPKFTDVEIGGGRIIGKESSNGGTPTEFAMYNADQYMKPDGKYTTETAADGSKWYKQTPQDTVQRTPYMDANGDVKYNETIVQQLPQIPRRKDRV